MPRTIHSHRYSLWFLRICELNFNSVTRYAHFSICLQFQVEESKNELLALFWGESKIYKNL